MTNTAFKGKALIITYYWPPSGGAGVQRWLKFAKYFAEYGWEPVILTVHPDYAAYPAIDHSLASEVPASVRVIRTRATDYFSFYNRDKSKIPSAGFASNPDNSLKGKMFRFLRGNFFIPDPRRGWNKYAFAEACRLIEEEDIKNVITTSPPHSTQLIGIKLRKKYPGLNWIADLRDPWTDIYYYRQFYPTFIARMIDKRYEAMTLRNADRIITIGRSLREHFGTLLAGTEAKTEIISNGYDEQDFSGLEVGDPEIFTISYIGTLSDTYPVNGFLRALEDFAELGNSFRMRFIGTVSDSRKDQIIASSAGSGIEFIPYVNHDEALKYMAGSSVLLMIIPDHPGNRSILTGKIFEYIASRRPVICLGPTDGDAAAVLEESRHGFTYDYNDSKAIAEKLEEIASGGFMIRGASPDQYSRRYLTSKVVSMLV